MFRHAEPHEVSGLTSNRKVLLRSLLFSFILHLPLVVAVWAALGSLWWFTAAGVAFFLVIGSPVFPLFAIATIAPEKFSTGVGLWLFSSPRRPLVFNYLASLASATILGLLARLIL